MGRVSDARERILESAGYLFYLNGYRAVSVGDICKRANARPGSFYHFFGSKQELALEVIDRYWKKVLERYRVALGGDRPLAEKLETLFSASMESQRRSAEQFGCAPGCLAGNLALELATQDEAIRAKVQEVFDSLAAVYREAVGQAMAAGEIAAGDPDLIARSLVTFSQGKAMMTRLNDDPNVLMDAAYFAKKLAGICP